MKTLPIPSQSVPALGLLLAMVLVTNLQADPPPFLSMFRKKQPASEESLTLKAEHGPWLILATTLSGDDAKTKAVSLAREIRNSMKLPSYVLEKSFDPSGNLAMHERIRTDIYGREQAFKVRYANGSSGQIYAVLVGEFTSTDDPRIQDVLRTIRFAHTQTLDSETADQNPDSSQADSSNWLVKKYRSLIWSRTDRETNQQKGKMGAAFVTRNPLLPEDYFQAPKVDDFVAKLNKNVEYSLLACPSRFTVRVASFQGHAITDFGTGATKSMLSDTTDALDRAALQAHKLTQALRRQGEEAYEFHDRFGSYVMIGSFNELGHELTTGEFQYNPAMLAVMNKWCGYEVVDVQDRRTGAISKTRSLKSLNKIPFDVDGKPMAVPRASTSKLYSGSLLGGR